MKRLRLVPLFLLAVGMGVALPARGDDERPAIDRDPAKLAETYAGLLKSFETQRGVPLGREVKLVPWPAEDSRVFMNDILDREFPVGRAEPLARLYARLGLVPDGYDMRKGIAAALGTETPFYFEPRKKTILVSPTDPTPDELRPLALFKQISFAQQDGHDDLLALHRKELEAENDDALTAVKFLSEGEAQFLFLDYIFRRDKREENLEPILETLAKRTREYALKQSRENVEKMGEKGRSMAELLDRIEELPPFLYRRFIDPPMMGAVTILRAKKLAGWPLVDSVWKRPPRSTAQVLHPVSKLFGSSRQDPTRVELPDVSAALGAGWKRSVSTTVGELGLDVLVRTRFPARVGCVLLWGGDRCHAFEAEDQPTAVVWAVTFAGPNPTSTFRTVLADLLVEKTGPLKDRKVGDATFSCAAKDGLAHAVGHRDFTVVLASGVPEASLDAVLSETMKGLRVTKPTDFPQKPEKE